MIKSKIKPDNSFGGNFTEGRIKEEWNTTEIIYEGTFLKPVWNGVTWVESATTSELEAKALKDQIEKQKEEKEKIYKAKVDAYVKNNLTADERLKWYDEWTPGTYQIDQIRNYKGKTFNNTVEGNINAPDKGGWIEVK